MKNIEFSVSKVGTVKFTIHGTPSKQEIEKTFTVIERISIIRVYRSQW